MKSWGKWLTQRRALYCYRELEMAAVFGIYHFQIDLVRLQYFLRRRQMELSQWAMSRHRCNQQRKLCELDWLKMWETQAAAHCVCGGVSAAPNEINHQPSPSAATCSRHSRSDRGFCWCSTSFGTPSCWKRSCPSVHQPPLISPEVIHCLCTHPSLHHHRGPPWHGKRESAFTR